MARKVRCCFAVGWECCEQAGEDRAPCRKHPCQIGWHWKLIAARWTLIAARWTLIVARWTLIAAR